MKQQQASEEYTAEEMLACHEEFIGQYRRLHQKRSKKSPGQHHLYALDHLCRFAEIKGLDCRWIYDAFSEELSSKSGTVEQNYYLGGFVYALTNFNCNPTQAIAETAFWLDISTSRVDEAYRQFLRMSGQWSPVQFSTVLTEQNVQIASAFINGVRAPFPKGKGTNTMAENAFNKLKEEITKRGLDNAPAPFQWKFKKRQ